MVQHGKGATLRVLLLTLIAASAAGCVAFNECEAPQGDVLGRAGIELDLRERVVRTQEAPVGNVVADAFFEAATAACAEGENPCPDLAMQNAGGLRQETACGVREAIPIGAILDRDVEELMPFENELVVVSLTGRDLALALERSVSALGQPGDAAEAGHFLHLSGVEVEVECGFARQTLSADQGAILNPGERVRAARIGGEPLDPDAEYEVATSSFVAEGGDGFLSFFFRDEDGAVITDGDGSPVGRLDPAADVVRQGGEAVTDRGAVKGYIERRADEDEAVGRPPEGRLQIAVDCYGG
jgi:2',3'-cyclic-nucleotide 2'-phosphodiesterase (5'-nucleotidase family)